MRPVARCSKWVATFIGAFCMKTKKHLNFTSLREKASEVFESIPDWRQKSKISISIHDAMMSGLACMYFQDPSLLQFQKRMQEDQHRNNLNTLFGVENVPKETQMREITDGVDSDYLRPIFRDYYLRLQRGKHLEQFQIFPSLYYFPIDGSQFYGSKEIHCEQCLVKEHQNGSKSYSHQVLQGGIAHPDCSQVIPFMPEQIVNTDGANKQDCEMNAAKRFVEKLHQAFPQLGLLLGGDALFSKQPIIEDVLHHNMHYLFAAKPDDHKYMMEWLNGYMKLNHIEFIDEQGRWHYYEWMNDVPLNGNKDTINVNFLRCTITGKNKKGEEEVLYKNSWATDLPISEENIKTLVKAGRCRWKSENEIFNVMKNQGYCMEHNYGHGQKNMAFNFYLLTLLAFFMHQIFELTDRQYQACREKFGSKKHLWEKLRSWIDIIIFETWEKLLEFALAPKKGLLTWAQAP
jgi:hypothetical protein